MKIGETEEQSGSFEGMRSIPYPFVRSIKRIRDALYFYLVSRKKYARYISVDTVSRGP